MKPAHFVIGGGCVAVLCLSIGVVFAIAMPRLNAQREAARRMQCSNHLKQIGLAIHNYHASYKRLPMGCGGTGGTTEANGNAYRLNGLAALLPFVEQQTVWEGIANPYPSKSNPEFPAMGPVPWYYSDEYPFFAQEVTVFRCPSDIDAYASGPRNNYEAQIAVTLSDDERAEWKPSLLMQVSHRGMFANRVTFRFSDCLDGLSNTIGIAEVATTGEPQSIRAFIAQDQSTAVVSDPSLCLQTAAADPMQPRLYGNSVPLWSDTRGTSWADGNIRYSGVTTVLPPNSPSCTIKNSEFEGVYSASSLHTGGCHILMMDGAVLFITDYIDSGTPSRESIHAGNQTALESPYGVWGALGTRAGNNDAAAALGN